ncbi:unnamed protein product [Clonostachys byssicola]|uniref:Uncharacterized protein n=1 Tax=Clonostachys byssicola TaxID=160290 RepID=A0A9N9U6S9_9HYPO|nr:unnamed protein product [Clonostachys byssicola]
MIRDFMVQGLAALDAVPHDVGVDPSHTLAQERGDGGTQHALPHRLELLPAHLDLHNVLDGLPESDFRKNKPEAVDVVGLLRPARVECQEVRMSVQIMLVGELMRHGDLFREDGLFEIDGAVRVGREEDAVTTYVLVNPVDRVEVQQRRGQHLRNLKPSVERRRDTHLAEQLAERHHVGVLAVRVDRPLVHQRIPGLAARLAAIVTQALRGVECPRSVGRSEDGGEFLDPGLDG